MRLIFCELVIIQLLNQNGFVSPTTNAIRLTNADFQSTVFKRSRYVFVYFYSSNCSECEDSAGIMNELAELMRPRYNIIIATADIDNVDVGKELNVKQTPSFKLIKSGDNTIVDYTRKTRTVESFAKFLEQHARVGLEKSNSVRDRSREREERRKLNIQHTDKFRRDEL